VNVLDEDSLGLKKMALTIRFLHRWLDLSGNRLGDTGCTEVVKAIRHCTSLQALDLSSNAIKNGNFFMEALVGPNGLSSRY